MPCILLYVDPVVLDTPRVTYRRGSGGATCPAGTDTGLPLEDSPTHRIQCGWLRRALPPRHVGQLSIRPPTPQATRPVQLRCRQRRKLHPGAVSTRQGMDMLDGGIPRAEQGNPEKEISFACNDMMYE